jgi:hypothetical protein
MKKLKEFENALCSSFNNMPVSLMPYIVYYERGKRPVIEIFITRRSPRVYQVVMNKREYLTSTETIKGKVNAIKHIMDKLQNGGF